MKRIYFVLILVGLLPAQEISWAEGGSAQGDELEISLITFGPGDQLTDWFGHTALAVSDTLRGQSRVYNFGLYSFSEGFVENFIFGRLIFWGGDARLGSTIVRYSNAGRSIYVQTLHLPAKARLKLAQELAFLVRPENAAYLYHHYYENCSTRLRDLIDQVTNGRFGEATKVPGRQTFREHTIRYTAQNPLMQWLLLFLMNDSIDKPIMRWDEMFLPDELARNVAEVSYVDSTGRERALEKAAFYQKTAPQRDPVPKEADATPWWPLLAGLLWAAFVFASMPKQRALLSVSALSGIVFGLLGSILFFMAFFTDHTVTHGNENLWIANPLTLIAGLWCLVLLFRKKPSLKKPAYLWLWHSLAFLLLLALKVFPAFDQDNRMALMLIGLPYLALGWAWLRAGGFLKSRANRV